MKLAFAADAEALAWLIGPALPPDVRVVFFLDPTLKVGIHAEGQYIKAKVALAEERGSLRADLKDVKVNGLSLGGNPWERFIPTGQFGPLSVRHQDGGILIGCAGLRVKAAGAQSDMLTLIVEVLA